MFPAGELMIKALFLTTNVIHRLTIDNNVVQLSHGGKVRGTILRSEEGRQFYAFKGIPYAEAPVGELRFKAPVAKKAWEEEIDATKEGPVCAQVDLFFKPGAFVGQEDCLTVNVYTPELPHEGTPNHKRDVLVYIHGGGFMVGTAETSFTPPERIMNTGNVFVAMNYRLDALGFLSTGDDAAPGNYGLLDQTLALQWVKDNIEVFGGNPESVSIFGHSAGGGSVSYHLISPLSKGLFHRALPMSGSSLSPWALETNPLRWAKYLASEIGCPEAPSHAMIECFRAKPPQKLVHGMGAYQKLLSFPLPFVPSVDGNFLQESPYETFFNNPKNINKVPVLTGITETEGSGFLAWVQMFNPNMTIASNVFVNYVLNTSMSGQHPEIIDAIRKQYYPSGLEKDEDEYAQATVDVLSDGLFKMDHYLEVNALAAAGVPVYAYSYEFQVDSLFPMLQSIKKYGVSHGADMVMYFDIKFFQAVDFTEREIRMSKFLLQTLSNFAKTGNPDPSHQYQPIWEPSEPNKIHILKINSTLSVQEYSIDNPIQKFWLDIKEKIRNRNAQ